jgi:hypothetical protein
MRISFMMDGGIAFFPGLNKPFHWDTAKMDAARASRIEALVRSAGFFELSSGPGAAARGAADYRTYTIGIVEGQRSHAVQVCDPVENPALAEFIGLCQEMMRIPPTGDG